MTKKTLFKVVFSEKKPIDSSLFSAKTRFIQLILNVVNIVPYAALAVKYRIGLILIQNVSF